MSEEGIFNLEGGSYPRIAGLDPKEEPDVFNAIRFGAIVENVKFYDDIHREIDFNDTSITWNIRTSYPLEYIPNAKIPGIAGHPKNIILLACDSQGVLPPVSKLTPEQALYYFLSGYTSYKPLNTGKQIDTKPNFSACFSEAVLPRHPSIYAEMLEKKILERGCNVWLVNTGWTNGNYEEGQVSSTNRSVFLSRAAELFWTLSITETSTRLSTLRQKCSSSKFQRVSLESRAIFLIHRRLGRTRLPTRLLSHRWLKLSSRTLRDSMMKSPRNSPLPVHN